MSISSALIQHPGRVGWGCWKKDDAEARSVGAYVLVGNLAWSRVTLIMEVMRGIAHVWRY